LYYCITVPLGARREHVGGAVRPASGLPESSGATLASQLMPPDLPSVQGGREPAAENNPRQLRSRVVRPAFAVPSHSLLPRIPDTCSMRCPAQHQMANAATWYRMKKHWNHVFHSRCAPARYQTINCTAMQQFPTTPCSVGSTIYTFCFQKSARIRKASMHDNIYFLESYNC
jgi:hypothetical protein